MRLTFINEENEYELEVCSKDKEYSQKQVHDMIQDIADKLGPIEDLMEKYGIDNVDDLKTILDKYFANKSYQKHYYVIYKKYAQTNVEYYDTTQIIGMVEDENIAKDFCEKNYRYNYYEEIIDLKDKSE